MTKVQQPRPNQGVARDEHHNRAQADCPISWQRPVPGRQFGIPYLGGSSRTIFKAPADGETGIRETSIHFMQQVLADNPAIEVASDVPPFKFTQWDGKLLREIPRLRVKPGAQLDRPP